MDPVSLIAEALAAGGAAAAAGATEGVKSSVKDAVVGLYERLTSALVGQAKDDPAAGKTLERYAGNPQGYATPIRDLITDSGADHNASIVQLARELLTAVDPAGAQVGRYIVNADHAQGVQVGDHNTQTIHHGSTVQYTAGRDIHQAKTIHVDNRTR